MGNKRYTFSENKITAQAIDETYNQLWLAFAQDDSGNCALKKTSGFDPSQIYYDIDISVTEITKLLINSTYLYTMYNDSSLIGSRYSVNNPLTTSIDFSIPSGITESPVDLLISGSNVWYLIPGDFSGTNTKLVKISNTGTFIETVDLPTVVNAKSFTIDSATNDIWIVTYTSPANLVRVYYTFSGWEYTVISLG